MLRPIELFPGGREKTSWLPRRAQQAFHLTARTTRCDDELGAFANVRQHLVGAGVDIYASSGVTDDRGSFGYSSVREDQFEKAVSVLGL